MKCQHANKQKANYATLTGRPFGTGKAVGSGNCLAQPSWLATAGVLAAHGLHTSKLRQPLEQRRHRLCHPGGHAVSLPESRREHRVRELLALALIGLI